MPKKIHWLQKDLRIPNIVSTTLCVSIQKRQPIARRNRHQLADQQFAQRRMTKRTLATPSLTSDEKRHGNPQKDTLRKHLLLLLLSNEELTSHQACWPRKSYLLLHFTRSLLLLLQFEWTTNNCWRWKLPITNTAKLLSPAKIGSFFFQNKRTKHCVETTLYNIADQKPRTRHHCCLTNYCCLLQKPNHDAHLKHYSFHMTSGWLSTTQTPLTFADFVHSKNDIMLTRCANPQRRRIAVALSTLSNTRRTKIANYSPAIP